MKFAALLIASVAAYGPDQDPNVQRVAYAEDKYKFTAAHKKHDDDYDWGFSKERIPHAFDRQADEDRVRVHYIDMVEQDQEDWDADMWAEQLLAYELNDDRDALEGDMSLAQDAKRAEFDDWWETFHQKPNFTGSYSYGHSYGYAPYHEIDARETLLKTNVLWNMDVLAARQMWRDELSNSRQGHRDSVADVVASYDAEVAALKQAMIDARAAKRADVAMINGELRAEVAALTAASHAQVDELNYKSADLMLELLEAYDTYGDHADIKLILTHHEEGGINIYDYDHGLDLDHHHH